MCDERTQRRTKKRTPPAAQVPAFFSSFHKKGPYFPSRQLLQWDVKRMNQGDGNQSSNNKTQANCTQQQTRNKLMQVRGREKPKEAKSHRPVTLNELH